MPIPPGMPTQRGVLVQPGTSLQPEPGAPISQRRLNRYLELGIVPNDPSPQIGSRQIGSPAAPMQPQMPMQPAVPISQRRLNEYLERGIVPNDPSPLMGSQGPGAPGTPTQSGTRDEMISPDTFNRYQTHGFGFTPAQRN
ncbi:hypothetical protein FRC01_009219, partial [Tulasnella sp. 417]